MIIPKYARIEHERRFLVTGSPMGLADAEACHVDDHYITGTRLRLRCLTPDNGNAPVFKLCKKYGAVAVAAEPIVNIYLTAGEYVVLAALPRLRVTKRRYHVMNLDRRFSLDIFEGALTGLMIAEVEAADATGLLAIAVPAWVDAEITDDPWFHGGHLATVGAQMLRERLEPYRQS